MGEQRKTLLNSNFLNFVPFVCACMVVVIHQYNAVALPSTSAEALLISFFSHGVSLAAVPMFFFLSGYLFFRNVHTMCDIVAKQKKRVVGIIAPFLAWSALGLLVFSFAGKLASGSLTISDLNPLRVLLGILFYEKAFPLWYLFELTVYVFLLSVPILFLLKQKKLAVLFMFGSLAVGLFVTKGITVSLGTYERALFQFEFFAYYLAGCIASRSCFVQKLKDAVLKLPLTVWILAFCAVGFLGALFFDEVLPSFHNRCMVPVIFVVFFATMLKLCEHKGEFRKPVVSTMVIYGIHSYTGLAVNRLLSAFGLSAVPHFVLSCVLVTLVSICAGYLMKKIKPLYRVFSGNR